MKGKLLVLVDSSSSMEVADDYHQARGARARQILEQWRRALSRDLQLTELEFDTALHKPGDAARVPVQESGLAAARTPGPAGRARGRPRACANVGSR